MLIHDQQPSTSVLEALSNFGVRILKIILQGLSPLAQKFMLGDTLTRNASIYYSLNLTLLYLQLFINGSHLREYTRLPND